MLSKFNDAEPIVGTSEIIIKADTAPSSTRSLPPFEPDNQSRVLCIIGLVTTCILSFASIGLSIPAFVRDGGFLNNQVPIAKSNAAKEVVALILNVGVTLCTETLGFVHATSLRWALYHERRLCFNSNLRLFTNAKKCAANSWYVNCVWALLVTVSYSTASQVILPTGGHASGASVQTYILNSQALAILGMTLLIQALLAFWCIAAASRSRRILSWNSSPLNTALALLHQSEIRGSPSQPILSWSSSPLDTALAPLQQGGIQASGCRRRMAPRRHQFAARKASKSIGVITICLWVLVPVIVAWGVAMWFVSIRMNGVPDKSFNPENDSSGVYPSSVSAGDSTGTVWSYQNLLGLAVITAMQTVYTLALHAAEQVVNLSRDEAVWRRAGNAVLKNHSSGRTNGAAISPGSLKAAVTMWQTLALLVLKPVSHWLFGLSAVIFSFGYLAFNPVPIFCLAAMSFVLAGLVTFLGYTKPKGPQPAAWGNLKKLTEFIDDWGNGAGDSLYWGDKGPAEEPGVRIAGTSRLREAVEDIRMERSLYIGLHGEDDQEEM